MSKLRLLLTSLFLFAGTALFAQNTLPVWSSYYLGEGDNSDRYNKVIASADGNYIGVGYTFRSGNYRDFLVVKFTPTGDTIWTRTKNGKASGMDEAVDATIDPSGNLFVAGFSDNGVNNTDILLIKYDAAGTKLFDTTWNSPAYFDDVPVAVASDASGNIFVGGNVEPDTISGSSDYITLKFDNNGGLIWSNQFSRNGITGGKDEMAAMIVDPNGDVYVTGRSAGVSDDDFVTIKYDGAAGTQSWQQVYNSGNGNDRGVGIAYDPAGAIVVTGRSKNANGNDDFRTVKYNTNGILQWSKFYNAPANQDDRATAIAIDASSNVYVTGQSDIDNSSGINYDFATVKYNSAGTQQWAKLIGSVFLQYDIPSAIVVDGNGNVFITGKSDQDAGIADDNDWMTVMYNNAGTLAWTAFKGGTSLGKGDTPGNLILDANSNVYVVGSVENDITQKDATVVEYDLGGTQILEAAYQGLGDFNAHAKNIVIDSNENSYTCGYTFHQDDNRDATIVGTNAGGTTTCIYSYKGSKSDDDEFVDLAMALNGSIVAVGYTKVSGQKSDILVVKFDPNSCDTVWTRTYDYIKQSDKADAVVLDAVGNIYVTGHSDSDPIDSLDNSDFVTMKFDGNGNLLWTQRYNGTGNLRDEPTTILLDGTGDVVVSGRTENVHDDEFMAIKYSSSTGAPVWGSPAIYGSPFANDDRPLDMTIDSNNNIFLCGYSQTSSGANATEDPVVVKFDPSGVLAGFYSYSGLGGDEAIAMGHDLSDNIFVAFRMDVDPNPLVNDYDFLTMKFDNSLSPIWVSPPTYASPIHQDDIPTDLMVTPAGTVYVTGTTENDTIAGRTNQNWLTVLYDDQGQLLMSSNIDGPNATDDAPDAIAIRGNSLWVCGYVEGTNNSQKDNAVLRYNITIGVKENSILSASNAYPNPFSSSTRISLSSQAMNQLHAIQVTDVTGALISQSEFTGNEYTFSKGNLAAGMYQYSILEKGQVIARGKLIIE
jgi:uncharacterized delta-60 repeat protein